VKQRDENADDGDYDKQLDEGEAAVGSLSGEPHGIAPWEEGMIDNEARETGLSSFKLGPADGRCQ